MHFTISPTVAQENSTVRLTRLLRKLGTVSPYLFGICAYFFISLATAPIFMADTFDYVASALASQKATPNDFWDFGHLLWRPSIWALATVLRPLTARLHFDQYYAVLLLTIAAVWISGLVSIVAFARLSGRLFRDIAITNWVVLMFACSQAYVNFVQTGSPYIPGLALICVALNLLLTDGGVESKANAVVGGLALAGAVLLWFPYVLVVPGVLLSPLLLQSRSRHQWIKLFAATCSCAMAGIATYSVIALHNGIHTVPQFQAWMSASAHGITNMGGIPRAVLGFSRAFFNLGNDGVLFKRFLKHDPYNPVSVWTLMRFSLWKIALFYSFVVVVFVRVFAGPAVRKIAVLFLVSAIPLMLFTSHFAGGDMEKYLPIYPTVYLMVAAALTVVPKQARFYRVTVVFSVLLLVNNLFALSRLKWIQKEGEVRTETAALAASVPVGSMIIVGPYERLANAIYDHPFVTTLQSHQIEMRTFTMLGRSTTPYWRSDLSARIQAALDHGRSVWVSDELRRSVPSTNDNWVEGDDQRISWNQVASFFQSLSYKDKTRAAGRFTMLNQDEVNRQIAAQWSRPASTD